jgi:hypothetical protein
VFSEPAAASSCMYKLSQATRLSGRPGKTGGSGVVFWSARAAFAMPILYRKFFCHAKEKVLEG